LNSFKSAVLRILAGYAFHARGPKTENARCPSFVRVLGTTYVGHVIIIVQCNLARGGITHLVAPCIRLACAPSRHIHPLQQAISVQCNHAQVRYDGPARSP